MNNDIDLQIRRSFDLARRFNEAGCKFAKIEEELVRDFRRRRFSENRRYADAMAGLEKAVENETREIEENFTRGKAYLNQFHEQRHLRIDRAHVSAATGVINAREARSKRITLQQLHATQNLPLDLKKVDESFQEIFADLARIRVKLIHLRRRARKSFYGYGSYLKLLSPRNMIATEAPQASGDLSGMLSELHSNLDLARKNLSSFRKFWIPRLFSSLPVQFILPLIFTTGVFFWVFPKPSIFHFILSGTIAGGLAAAVFGIYRIGLRRSSVRANAFVASLSQARRLYDACSTLSKARYEQDRARIQEDYERTMAHLKKEWGRTNGGEAFAEENMRAEMSNRAVLALGKNERLLQSKLRHLESEHSSRLALQAGTAETRKMGIAEVREKGLAMLTAEESTRWKELQDAWRDEILPIYEAIRVMNAFLDARSPAWNADLMERWEPPESFPSAVKFASINLNLSDSADTFPKDSRFALPGPSLVSIPLALTFPAQGSLLFETPDSGDATVLGTLNNIILRLLWTTPPGKIAFTIIDPIGLGQNFAGLMHLSDFEESLINRRIWTQQDQIEERLEELNEHIEKVIQMYLRNEYATITEYNEQAGSVAEKYHFLVVADFPANFSETAAKRLQSITSSGSRCGVFTLIHRDLRHPPDGLVPDELRKNSVCIRRDRNEWSVDKEEPRKENELVFDRPPEPELSVELVQKIGQGSIDSNRVEVPFTQIAPKTSEMWQGETSNELRVAIGRTGATKFQYLALGRGTRQHALIAGKTGSGKSTLFHIIITNLALTYSPDQVEFYLIDFKKGVEFKCYATRHLPHARVIAIESDREFALSVLQRVDEELKRRGDMFRKLGVQDIAGYRRAGGTEPIPRSLLIIDEFQEFFVQDDQISQTAALLFDRIVRQGRAFGIHVLLGSQTLGGAYTLARTTLGQMVVRIALQCNEADAYLIMDDNNPAPRLLSRPGEGIYNDAAGALEGNSPFQVVWLGDEERDQWLEQIRALDSKPGERHGAPIVFEGNAPADIQENALLHSLLENAQVASPPFARCWLGAPNSIKGPTEALFRRQSGNNLLIVGQRDEAMLTMMGVSLIALAAQYPPGTAKFFLFHTPGENGSGGDFLEEAAAAIPHRVTMVQSHNLSDVLIELAAELDSRSNGGTSADAPAIFVLIHGLQRFKKLRQEDDFDFSGGSDSTPSPSVQFNTLLTEGSSHGIHLLVTLDTFNNLNRFLSRKALSEFELRVVFQMSANDSASLIDSPQASNLGLHRALFYNEHDGGLETFRPYALPSPEWLQAVSRKLSRIHQTNSPLSGE